MRDWRGRSSEMIFNIAGKGSRTSWLRAASVCHDIESFFTFKISDLISLKISWCIAEVCWEYVGMMFFVIESLMYRSMRGFKFVDRMPAKWFEISGRRRSFSISLGRLWKAGYQHNATPEKVNCNVRSG
jgi:hypothetical protein